MNRCAWRVRQRYRQVRKGSRSLYRLLVQEDTNRVGGERILGVQAELDRFTRTHRIGAITVLLCAPSVVLTAQATLDSASQSDARPTFEHAEFMFYNGRYEAAAALALALRDPAGQDLATYELRTSALLFRLKQLLARQPDKAEALARCATCPALLMDFLSDTAIGQKLARAKLAGAPEDDETLFFLGKLDLNYVWLQLDPLGKRTGWEEYWEARRSLDTVLKHNPMHVRARVARAWIDYIVDTRMPRGTRWVLGGGNRERALWVANQAAAADTDFFAHAEAGFALWEMQVREKRMDGAIDEARALARDFPDNRQIADFLQIHALAR